MRNDASVRKASPSSGVTNARLIDAATTSGNGIVLPPWLRCRRCLSMELKATISRSTSFSCWRVRWKLRDVRFISLLIPGFNRTACWIEARGGQGSSNRYQSRLGGLILTPDGRREYRSIFSRTLLRSCRSSWANFSERWV